LEARRAGHRRCKGWAAAGTQRTVGAGHVVSPHAQLVITAKAEAHHCALIRNIASCAAGVNETAVMDLCVARAAKVIVFVKSKSRCLKLTRELVAKKYSAIADHRKVTMEERSVTRDCVL